jgi:hypothetical protein
VRLRRSLARLVPVLAIPLSLTLPGSLTPVAQASSVVHRTTTAFVVHDPVIDEDSALVQAGTFFVTTNDSGNSADVYTLNQHGRTVGDTHWAKSQIDCEAIAPVGAHNVWVADIGDNHSTRASVSIAKVPVGRGDRDVRPPQYVLAYPDGAHNAETLVRDPNTGRLYIATKDVAGGALYRVPRPLSADQPNTLKLVPSPDGILHTATDGAFFRSGHYLVIRNYNEGELYAWPSMRSVGTFKLPVQKQGEGLASATGGSVFLSSEGVRQPVLHYRLAARFRRVLKTTPPA